MGKKIRRHYYVDGRVQGVGFRYTAYYVAQSMGLTGWVKNLDDGRVELEVQGASELVNRFLEQVETAGKWIHIDDIVSTQMPIISENSFHMMN